MRGSVVNKKGKWYIAVYFGMVAGKRKYKWYSGYSSREEAETDLPNIMLDVQKGIVVDTSTMNARQFFDLWLEEHVSPNTTGSTYDKYSAAAKSASAVFGHEKIQKLKPVSVQRWINQLAKDGKSKGTITSYYTAVKSAFNKALQWQMITHTPCLNITTPKQKKKTMRTLSAEEVTQLLATAEGTPMHLVILLAAGCGLRRGEILGLTWKDIDLENRVIHVTEALTQNSTGVKMAELKTEGSHRSVDINDSVKQAMKRQISAQETFIRESRGNVVDIKKRIDMNDVHVCAWQDNVRIRPDYVTKSFPKILKMAELPKIRFHDLRHTHATLLLKAGVHPKIVQERLGHSNIKITMNTYSHVLPSMQREAAEILVF